MEISFTHLNVPLKVKEVDSLPVAAIQGQDIPGLRVGKEKQKFRVKIFLKHAT